MNLTRTRVAILYAMLAFTFFAVVMNAPPQHGWIDWYRLSTSGRVVQATVTQLQPENHQGCFFTYTVDSHVYKAWGSECTAAVGQQVPATYAPSDPSFVSLHAPMKEFLFMVFAPFILSPIGGYFCALRWDSKRRRSGA